MFADFTPVRHLKLWRRRALEFTVYDLQPDFAGRDRLEPSAMRTPIEAAVINPTETTAGTEDDADSLYQENLANSPNNQDAM